MAKKFTVFFALVAFFSFSSVGMACNTSCKGDKDKSGDTEAVSLSIFDTANSGCNGGGCGKKDRGNP